MTSLLIGLAIAAVLVGAYCVGLADGRLEAREAEARRVLTRAIKELSDGAPHGR